MNIYLFCEKKNNKNYQFKLVPNLNPKTTNGSSKQVSITNVMISHSSTFELKKRGDPRHGSSKVFLLIN
jgi:hypothetical protein